MIYDNDYDDTLDDLGEYYSEDEDIQDYSQDCTYSERTRELDGSLSWNDTELSWGMED